MSYQSKYTGQEIDSKLDKIGEVEVLDSLSANFVETTPVEGDVLQLTNITGNITVKDGNKIVVKEGQRVQINAFISYTERDAVSDTGNIRFVIRDITNNINIQTLQGYQDKNYQYEFSRSVSAQYTNETNADCEISIVCTNIFGDPDTISSEMSGITIHEIGRAIVIPYEYKEVELLSEPVKFQQGGSGHKTINQDVTLLDDIFNYDEIVFTYYAEFSNGSRAGLTEYRMQVSNHEYIHTDGTLWQLILAIPTQNVRQLLFCFPASNMINIGSTCMTSGSGDGYFHLSSIKGIKY